MRGVIVFVKNPEFGKVKTRLAATLGDEMALEIYNKLLAYTRNVLLGAKDVKKYVYYSSFVDKNDDWSNEDFDKHLQYQGGLGERIISAFKSTFDECDQVVIIGSDCPQLTSEHIEEAFLKLNTHDVVIGPSHDGGYYLLGMNNFYPQLFNDINWSTESVFQETLDRAQANELSTAELETLTDVDYQEDWEKYGF